MEKPEFSSKTHVFPYENGVASEGNTTILPMERKWKFTFSPMRTDELKVGVAPPTSRR